MKCLDILRKQTDSIMLKKALDTMYTDVQSGTSLSDSMAAMGETFPEVVVQMVRAGEASGTLEHVMERLGNNFEKSYKIRQRITGAMIYPIVIGSLALCVTLGLVIFIVPTFANVFESVGAELPFLTKALIAFSNFLINYGVFVLMLLIAGIIFYRSATSKGENRVKKDKRKAVGKNVLKKMRRQMITASFCRSLSGLLSAGVSFTESLIITSRVLENAYAERIVMEMQEQVRRGRSLGTMLAEVDFFPEMVQHLVTVGEETGTIDDMLSRAADFYESEVDNTVGKLTAAFEPMMMIGLGAVIGIMVLAILMPMFQMASVIGG
jgi:type IV pilus assembly protein PilC